MHLRGMRWSLCQTRARISDLSSASYATRVVTPMPSCSIVGVVQWTALSRQRNEIL
jgi:hypothetical protein